MDWLDLLAVQRTLKSFLQHHSFKAPIHQHSAFFMVFIYIHYVFIFDCSGSSLLLFSLVSSSASPVSRSVVSNSLRPHGLQHTRIPALHHLTAFVDDAIYIMLCHALSSCLQSLPASGSFPMSQFLHQVAKVLEFQLQHQSFQWIFRTDFLQGRLAGSPPV